MRKSRQLKIKKEKIRIKTRIILCLFLTLTFVFLAFLFFKVLTLDKFAYVNNKDGNVEVIIIDPQKDKNTKILIDKDFKVDASRNFGEYKIGSLWILGEKEKYGGKLVSETVTKNFLIPVYFWKDKNKSNLNIYQRIKGKIVEKKLIDYEYNVWSQKIPESVLINFSDPKISEQEPKIKIEDLTGDNQSVEKITNILGIYGVKITSFTKGFDEILDCEVGGKLEILVNSVSQIFDCKKTNLTEEFDLIVRVGKGFAVRF